MLFQYVLHAAYAISALSFAVRDILWLRLLAVVSAALEIVVSVNTPGPSFALVTWQSLFITVNAVRIATTVYGERTARFNDDEAELYQALFKDMTRLEFLKLLRLAAWEDAPSGTVLAREGEPLDRVMLIHRGRARVEAAGRTLAWLRDGQFIGEMGFASAEPASATVTAVEPTRYLRWGRAGLQEMLVRNPSLRLTLRTVLASDMSRKLRAHAETPPEE